MKIKKELLLVNMALRGYTMYNLAKVSGVSKATISAVKNGKSCSFNTAANLAKALGLEVTALIESGT